MNKTITKEIVIGLMAVVLLVFIFSKTGIVAYAEDTTINVSGKLYEFDEKSEYEYSSVTPVEIIVNEGKLGSFSISGDIKPIADINGFSAYQVQHSDVTDRKDDEGIVQLSYELGDTLVSVAETDWHIVEDKTSKINEEKLDEKILNGAIILQTSLDGETWITDVIRTNIAADKYGYETNFYNTKGIQQINGCYFRVIIVYKIERRVNDTKIVGPITQKNYEDKKYAEIYEFYLIDSLENVGDKTLPTATPRKELGKRINTGKDNGFSGNEAITDKDPHFGWDIGTFYLNGYTREQIVAGNEEPIFLKTVGDRVTLWFHLQEDINCLNGKEKLSINEDKNGYDQYFGVEKTNFKHGALIIQFTDFEGKVHDPVIYTDYLAANAKTDANTKVELFEEGDYEVALDYEIKDSTGINSYTNYQIFIKFKIRNGNCMVYPFDVSTGAELSDNTLTENGFILDLAKSRYLTIDITRNAVKKENNRYFLDTRINTATQEGKTYTTEGIYTFTVNNPSTGESTTKTIYVGSSPIYRALAKGETIEKINEQLAQGGQLQNDGSILFPLLEESEELTEAETEEKTELRSEEVVEASTEAMVTVSNNVQVDIPQIDDTVQGQGKSGTPNTVKFAIVGIAIVIIISLINFIKKKAKSTNREDADV